MPAPSTRWLRRARGAALGLAVVLLVLNALGGITLDALLTLNVAVFVLGLALAWWVHLRAIAGPEPLGPGWAERPSDGSERLPPRIG